MAYPVVLSKTAETQLRKLQAYLARRFYSDSAERFINRLLGECMSLGVSPHRGRQRDEVRPGIRVIGFGRRTAIYFRFADGKVTILGIQYGGREGNSEKKDEG
jgi:toxin ParE1/3/4